MGDTLLLNVLIRAYFGGSLYSVLLSSCVVITSLYRCCIAHPPAGCGLPSANHAANHRPGPPLPDAPFPFPLDVQAR